MKIPKILAMYLPQFHRVKENDEWWGEGFTEWTTVKAAKPLYSGHEQPIQPWEYYDLMEKEVVCRQAEYMHQYGVDGMCFYHYYFENGKKILERPAENLLKWKDVDMPFCFYWANESWIRSWSNIAGNSWTENFETEGRGGGEGVLLKQNYGDRLSWEEHFQYLLPFFKDDRYIKIDGCPIFIIYRPTDIENLAEMKKCWNELIRKEGLPSIFWIGNGTDGGILDRVMLHEPMNTWLDFAERKFQNQYGFQYYLDYDEVWERILRRQCTDEMFWLGGFVGFDDTPRRGYKGKIMYGGTPEKFEKYLIRLLLKGGKLGNEFIFINAWNEWGEGMHLEPDRKYGNQYLESLRAAKDFAEKYGDVIEASWSDNSVGKEVNGNQEEIKVLSARSERYKGYWQILNRWLALNIQGKTVCEYFREKGYNRVAVYGLGILGARLVDEMQRQKRQILYGIDQDEYKVKKFNFPVYRLRDTLPEADIIIITVEYAFYNIKQQLREKNKCNLISLNELLSFAEGI